MEKMEIQKEQREWLERINFSQGKSPRISNLIDLFFRPVVFFKSNIALGKTPYLFFCIWIVGIATAIDRIDKGLLKNEYSSKVNSSLKFIASIAGSWLFFWAFVLILGTISGFFLWFLGGWFYNKRVEWCSAQNHDKNNGKILFIYTQFIIAFPLVILSLIQMFFYSDYLSVYNSKELYSVLILIFPFWSVIISHKAVNIVFELNRAKAKFWFLILPILGYVFALGLVAGLFSFLELIKTGS